MASGQLSANKGRTYDRTVPHRSDLEKILYSFSLDTSENLPEDGADPGGHGHGEGTPKGHPIMGLITSAPPAFAPIIPSKAWNINEPIATTGSRRAVGDSTRSTNDANAACTGRAVVVSEMPSASRVCAPKASVDIP
jgi:hypothetical protein